MEIRRISTIRMAVLNTMNCIGPENSKISNQEVIAAADLCGVSKPGQVSFATEIEVQEDKVEIRREFVDAEFPF